VDIKGIITTVAGNGSSGYSGDSGPATNASLSDPLNAAVDAAGNLFIGDYGNARIRKVDANGLITTVAGNGSTAYSGDGGPAIDAGLNKPTVAVDASGNLFIADRGNNRIRKVDLKGIITTVAGNGSSGYSGDGGAATNASLNNPSDVAVDDSGNLFIADLANNRIRKVDTQGIITTVAGNGSSGYAGDGGPATNASLTGSVAVALDASDNLFIGDSGNNRIRKVDAQGIITTVAGNGSSGYSGDGGAATNASLNKPADIAVDASGNLFITDFNNNRIREVALVGLPVLSFKIVMNVPLISGANLLLGFSLSPASSASFTLLQAPNITGPWMTNTVTVLTTNSQTGVYQFSLPVPGSVEFYQVRSP
jgi:sugar lactone lactonase YvrE